MCGSMYILSPSAPCDSLFVTSNLPARLVRRPHPRAVFRAVSRSIFRRSFSLQTLASDLSPHPLEFYAIPTAELSRLVGGTLKNREQTKAEFQVARLELYKQLGKSGVKAVFPIMTTVGIGGTGKTALLQTIGTEWVDEKTRAVFCTFNDSFSTDSATDGNLNVVDRLKLRLLLNFYPQEQRISKKAELARRGGNWQSLELREVCVDVLNAARQSNPDVDELVVLVDEVREAGNEREVEQLLSAVGSAQQSLIEEGHKCAFVFSALSTKEPYQLSTGSKRPLALLGLPPLTDVEDTIAFINTFVTRDDFDCNTFPSALRYREEFRRSRETKQIETIRIELKPGAAVYRNVRYQICMCGGHPRSLVEFAETFKKSKPKVAALKAQLLRAELDMLKEKAPTLAASLQLLRLANELEKIVIVKATHIEHGFISEDAGRELLSASVLKEYVPMDASYGGQTVEQLSEKAAVMFTCVNPQANLAQIRVHPSLLRVWSKKHKTSNPLIKSVARVYEALDRGDEFYKVFEHMVLASLMWHVHCKSGQEPDFILREVLDDLGIIAGKAGIAETALLERPKWQMKELVADVRLDHAFVKQMPTQTAVVASDDYQFAVESVCKMQQQGVNQVQRIFALQQKLWTHATFGEAELRKAEAKFSQWKDESDDAVLLLFVAQPHEKLEHLSPAGDVILIPFEGIKSLLTPFSWRTILGTRKHFFFEGATDY